MATSNLLFFFVHIVNFFNSISFCQGFDVDEQLKENQRNEIVAYSALLSDRLLPAIVSTCINSRVSLLCKLHSHFIAAVFQMAGWTELH